MRRILGEPLLWVAGAVVQRPDLPVPPALSEQEHSAGSAIANAYEKARVTSVIAAWARS